MSTDDDNTAAMVTDLATATELIHAVARDARSTARELEASDLYTLGTSGGWTRPVPSSRAWWSWSASVQGVQSRPVCRCPSKPHRAQ